MSLLIKLPHKATADEAMGAADRSRPPQRLAERLTSGPHCTTRVPLTVIASDGSNAQRQGRVQSAIAALFRAQPDRVFTAVDLAQAIHGGATRTTCKTIRRAADRVAGEMGWMRRRMEGRVDYVRPNTVSRITRLRTEKAARLMAPSY